MGDKLNGYKRVLKAARSYDFLTPGEEAIAQDRGTDAVFLHSTALVTAPSLTAYVIWILTDAAAKGIRTLYFLARDGLVLCRIAKALCRAWRLDIECKYLYGSRIAWRLPLYVNHRDYALDKLCAPTYKVTLKDILQRANIDAGHGSGLADELGIRLCEPLTKSALLTVKEGLAASDTFQRLASLNAREALRAVIGYLRQEFFSATRFALVDTGWEGSMQACLSLLLRDALGAPPPITGYYLGMFRQGQAQYGQYNCFLFHNARELLRFRGFNNNLAECLCAADHGMTLGYRQTGDQWVPVLAEFEQGGCRSAWDAHKQIELCRLYAERFASANPEWKKHVAKKELAGVAKRLLLGLMAKPLVSEAQLYGAIPFSDGLSADISTVLADQLSPEQMRYKSFSYRVGNLLMGRRGANAPDHPTYWINGAMALSDCGAVRRLDMRLLDALYWVLYR